MNIEKLFGSKTKVDILKYLVFRRQGISMRALEAELWWTFPAIKKQVDILNAAEIVTVDKDKTKWSITINDDVRDVFEHFFLFALQKDIKDLLTQYNYIVQGYYLGRLFHFAIETDLVIVYQYCEQELLDEFKRQITIVFRNYGIETVYVTFLSAGDWQKRLQLADKFVLWVLRAHSK